MVDEKKCGFDVKTSSFNNLTLSFSGINFVGVVYQPPPSGRAGEKEHWFGKVKKIRKEKKNNNNGKTHIQTINNWFIALSISC